MLDVEQELNDVAVPHDIFLAFGALQAGSLDGGIIKVAAGQIVIPNDLGPDKAALKVGMDLAGSLRGLGALFDRPGTAFLLPSVKKLMSPSSV